MKNITAAILLLVSFNCFADEWRTEDTYREVTYLSVLAIDWGQTRNIAHHPESWHEEWSDWVMTANPSIHQVDNYFAVSALINICISYTLPQKYRSPFQYLNIGYELKAIHNNFRVGIGVEF